MYKVLIVDDETIIRRGLKNIIDWKSLGCVVCGEAANGEEGQDLIKSLRPEIIITDINMPGVDGLRMIRETKELIPKCKVIILTGYRDFEFTQQAIRLGAFDYILKPSKIEDITNIVRRAVDELQKEDSMESELNKLKKNYESKIPILAEKLLYDIIFTPNYENNEATTELSEYGIELDEYIVMALDIDEDSINDDRKLYEKRLYQFGIINTFEDIIKDEFKIINVPVNSNLVMLIVLIKGQEDMGEIYMRLYNYSLNLQELVKNCFNFTVTIALSTIGKGSEALGSKARESMEALEYKFYMGKDAVILYEDLRSIYKTTDLTELEKYTEPLLQSIKLGDKNNSNKLISEILNTINEKSMDKDGVKNFYWNIINSIYMIPSQLKLHEDTGCYKNIMDLFLSINQCESVNELSESLKEISERVIEAVNSFNKKKMNQTLKKALDYINMNYSSPITLNEVAENIYVSIYYLSRMFTKELGKSFNDYLNEVRVEKAKEYLKEGSYKAYEIAELVGIKDAHYFSKIFKKYTGTTPSEYKNN